MEPSTYSEVQLRQVRTQPHGNSYFLSGKIAGKPATFLLDSGCTTNLLSRQFFDTLSTKVKNGLEPYEGSMAPRQTSRTSPFMALLSLLDTSATRPSGRRSSLDSSMRMPSSVCHSYNDTGVASISVNLRC